MNARLITAARQLKAERGRLMRSLKSLRLLDETLLAEAPEGARELHNALRHLLDCEDCLLRSQTHTEDASRRALNAALPKRRAAT